MSIEEIPTSAIRMSSLHDGGNGTAGPRVFLKESEQVLTGKVRPALLLKGIGAFFCLLLLVWQMPMGCADIGQTCDDKVCIITAYKRCNAARDCCCGQSCTLGCCLPNGSQGQSALCFGGSLDGGVPDGKIADCVNGKQRACFTGNTAWLGLGLCKAGVQTCQGGQWSGCVGDVLAVDERCDGKDNDCNGAIDDGLVCDCKPNEQRTCGINDCVGMQTCNGKREWGRCVPTAPKKEICDGIDNNCNGYVDDAAGCAEIAAGVSSGSKHFVQIWDQNTQNALRLLVDAPRHKEPILALVYRPDGKELATASADFKVSMWDPELGVHLQTLDAKGKSHTSEVHALVYSPDGRLLASGDAKGEIRVWELASGKLIHELVGEHSKTIHSLVFDAKGLELISTGADGLIVRWDVTSGKKIGELGNGKSGSVVQLVATLDGLRLASIVSTKLQIWDTQTMKLTKEYDFKAPFSGVVFSPQSNNVVITTTQGEIQRWDISNSKKGPFDQWVVSWAKLNVMRGLAIDSKGERIAMIGEPLKGNTAIQSVYLFELRTAVFGLRLNDAFGEVTAIAFRP